MVHFCEAHGPTVMCCTQAGHKDQPNWSLINFSSYPCSSSQDSQPDLSRGGLNNYLGGMSYSSSLLDAGLSHSHYSVPSSFSAAYGTKDFFRRKSSHSGSSSSGVFKEQTLLGRSPGVASDPSRRYINSLTFKILQALTNNKAGRIVQPHFLNAMLACPNFLLLLRRTEKHLQVKEAVGLSLKIQMIPEQFTLPPDIPITLDCTQHFVKHV